MSKLQSSIKELKARRTATKHPSAIHRSHTRRRVCFTPGTNSAITAKPSTVLTLFLPQRRKPRKCSCRIQKSRGFPGYSSSSSSSRIPIYYNQANGTKQLQDNRGPFPADHVTIEDEDADEDENDSPLRILGLMQRQDSRR